MQLDNIHNKQHFLDSGKMSNHGGESKEFMGLMEAQNRVGRDNLDYNSSSNNQENNMLLETDLPYEDATSTENFLGNHKSLSQAKIDPMLKVRQAYQSVIKESDIDLLGDEGLPALEELLSAEAITPNLDVNDINTINTLQGVLQEYQSLADNLIFDLQKVVLPVSRTTQTNPANFDVIFDFSAFAIGKLSFTSQSQGEVTLGLKTLELSAEQHTIFREQVNQLSITPTNSAHMQGNGLLGNAYRITPTIKFVDARKSLSMINFNRYHSYELIERSLIVTSKGKDIGIIIRDYFINQNELNDVMDEVRGLFKDLGFDVSSFVINGNLYQNRGNNHGSR